jgi:hypothetical protein
LNKADAIDTTSKLVGWGHRKAKKSSQGNFGNVIKI